MIKGKTVLGVIVARGGSKGLLRKNLCDLGGRPLVAWSVAAAHDSAYLDRTILSSEDGAIIAAARAAGCDVPFVRPSALSEDDSSIYDVLFHALDTLQGAYSYIVLLQATSPLRTGADIDACIEMCTLHGAPACISVTTPSKSPYWMHRLDESGRLHRLLDTHADRRQNLPAVVVPNGAVYVAEVDWLQEKQTFFDKDTRAIVMPPERSIDIDGALDLMLARAILTQCPQFSEPEGDKT